MAIGLLVCACRDQPAAPPPPAASPRRPSAGELAAIERERKLDAEFPLHGLVTGVQLKVRRGPDSGAPTLGWLRAGAQVRLGRDPAASTETCASGFYRVARSGFACPSEGIQLSTRPFAAAGPSARPGEPARRNGGLPYDYYYVKEAFAPEYHRLPSREEHRAVMAFVARYLELRERDPKLGARLLAGEIENEPVKLEIVRRFVERGFFVASTGIETRAERQFVRTVRGSYLKLTDLDPRKGSSFHGVVLDERARLPIAWAVRAAESFSATPDPISGAVVTAKDEASRQFDRLTRLPWVKRERVGDQIFHRLDDGRFIKSWYAAVAAATPRPPEVLPDERWIHVNLEQQTLVMYRGDTPLYATLVSTGLPGHATKPGLFQIRSKHVSTSMSDIGPDVSDDLRYSIEDVPWTQYYAGSLALHGAFWHAGFGLPHSHGCVNLSPLDARWLFEHTAPELDPGWHGVTTEGTGRGGTKLWITER